MTNAVSDVSMLPAAERDPQKAEKLERKAARLEKELRQKDTDACRRQHAAVT